MTAGLLRRNVKGTYESERTIDGSSGFVDGEFECGCNWLGEHGHGAGLSVAGQWKRAAPLVGYSGGPGESTRGPGAAKPAVPRVGRASEPGVDTDRPGDVSRWISYSNPIFQGDDTYREYTYELPFQAEAGDDFYMRVAADNGTHVYLNQVTADHEVLAWGSLDPNNWTPFTTWSPWMNVSDLLSGDNTLICVVANLEARAQVTGLRVEFGVTGEGSGTGWHPVPDSGLPVWLAGICFGIPLAVKRVRGKANA